MRNIVSGFLGIALGAALGVQAATLPVQDGFETYVDGTKLNTLGGTGWGASSDEVIIKTVTNVADPVLGTNAVFVPAWMAATNLVTAADLSNVWVDVTADASMGMDPGVVKADAVDAAMTVQLFLDTNGFPVVWNPSSNAWLVCSQDVWQTSASAFNTSRWVRLSLCQNYSNKTASLFMNQHLMLTGLRFIDTNQTAYARFMAVSGYSVTSYLDQVSMNYSPPASLTADVDDDGMADAQEIQLYGNIGTWRRLVLTAAALASGGPSATGGTVTLSTNSIVPGSNVTCSLAADIAYAVAAIQTNGITAVSVSGEARTASRTISNIWADTAVTGVFAYTARRYVPGDYATLQAAVAASLAGDTIVAAAGDYSNPLTLDRSLTLVGTNVTLLGALTLNGGVTGTLSGCQGLVVSGGVTVATGGLLVLSNGVIDLGTLTVQSGATVQVVNATSLTVNGVLYSGDHTFAYGWESALIPQTPPYADAFDTYSTGDRLDHLGYVGWTASSASVTVQTSRVQSGQAVVVPVMDSLSSTMTASASTNVWIDFYFQDDNRIAVESLQSDALDTNLAVQAFIGTNGYVTVYNPDLGGWDVCSTDAVGVAVAQALPTQTWARLTFNVNYARGRAAVFVDGRLLRQDLRFINAALTNSGSFTVQGGYMGPTYLDTYRVLTNASGIVSGDSDGDLLSDAWEIDKYRSIFLSPIGTEYLIR